MREITSEEVAQVSGGGLTFNEAAGMIATISVMGGPVTAGFGLPIALALYYVSK